eukprot:710460-Hanusia_phi.AAC.1
MTPKSSCSTFTSCDTFQPFPPPPPPQHSPCTPFTACPVTFPSSVCLKASQSRSRALPDVIAGRRWWW